MSGQTDEQVEEWTEGQADRHFILDPSSSLKATTVKPVQTTTFIRQPLI